MNPAVRSLWYNSGPGRKRKILLGLKLSITDDISDRKQRDLAVKVFMDAIDLARQQVALHPLCGSTPNLPAFSISQAANWMQEQEQDPPSPLWEDLQ
jgi:hypothetical protein